MPDRRSFLRNSIGVAIAAAASPLAALEQAREEVIKNAPKMPPRSLYDQNEDAYWAELRKQFLIPADEVYLNNGTNGSSPWPVLQAIIDGYLDTERMAQVDPEDYPIWGYGPWMEFRKPLADFVGCRPDEIALLRNATEANSYIANGFEMKAGDEVLMSDQEHPGGEHPWNLRAKRYGVVVKKFQLPKPPKDAAEILNRINDAITPKTRILFLSHITTVTGVVSPAKEIAKLCRDKGIVSAFDGAHVPGMMKLDINDLGCDIYTASPHKWLQAPKGSGFLFVREEVMPQIWNTIVTEGWNEPELKAERFQRIGSSNVPNLWGLRASIELANQIGMDRIEKRHRKMADYIHDQMLRRGAISWTSSDPALRCAIATVNVPPLQRMEMEKWMWTKYKIRIRGGEPSKLRLSTPYFLQKREIDRFLEKFDEYKKLARA